MSVLGSLPDPSPSPAYGAVGSEPRRVLDIPTAKRESRSGASTALKFLVAITGFCVVAFLALGAEGPAGKVSAARMPSLRTSAEPDEALAATTKKKAMPAQDKGGLAVGDTSSENASSSNDDDIVEYLDITDDDPHLTVVDTCDSNCGGEALSFPTEVQSTDGELIATLSMQPARFQSAISITTRSYSSNGRPGQTLRVNPGDSMKLLLKNDLDFPTQADVTFTGFEHDYMEATGQCTTYGSPNVTSLHFHGMYVDPNFKGDNMDRVCSPHETIEYDIDVPSDHPSGIFWYHPHQVFSTSIQIMGLAGGMIIVNDVTEDSATGETVTLASKMQALPATTNLEGYKDISLINMLEDVPMLLQYLAVDTTFKDFDFLSLCSMSSMVVDMEVYTGMTGNEAMFVNGIYKPRQVMTRGVYQRWRLVNGMGHRYLGLVAEDVCEMWAIAADGVYYSSPRKIDEFFTLTLASRLDMLVSCSESVVLRTEEPQFYSETEYSNIFGTDPGFIAQRWMQIEVVEPTSEDAAKVEASDILRSRFEEGTASLPGGWLGLDPQSEDNSDAATYTVTLDDAASSLATLWYTINQKTYTSRMVHRVRLGQMQKWTVRHLHITSAGSFKNHNFHLHTFHFQIDHVVDRWGTKYYTSPSLDWVSGDWRDTVNVPRGGSLVMRWMPTRYTGTTMYHCHIYNHETAGMKAMIGISNCTDAYLKSAIDYMCSSEGDYPFETQNSKKKCEESLRYMCSDAAMNFEYSSNYDHELTASDD